MSPNFIIRSGHESMKGGREKESHCIEVLCLYVAVPKQNTEYQYWKHTEVSLPV